MADRIDLAFAADAVHDGIQLGHADHLRGSGLNVQVAAFGVHLGIPGDDLDALLAGLVADVHQRGGVVRGDAQHVHALGDVVLDDADLAVGGTVVRTVVHELKAEFLGRLLKAGDTSLEIGVAGLLVDDADGDAFARLLSARGDAEHQHHCQNESQNFLHGDIPPFILLRHAPGVIQVIEP